MNEYVDTLTAMLAVDIDSFFLSKRFFRSTLCLSIIELRNRVSELQQKDMFRKEDL